MGYPKVKFRLNKSFDKEIGADFLNQKIGSYDFGKDRIISEHPIFSKWRTIKESDLKRIVNAYVDKYYVVHEKEMRKSVARMQKTWGRVEKRYFFELEKVFGPLSFYSPKVIMANLSIFKCGVVDENMRAFQIWYKTDEMPGEVRRHVAHEVLHFYYYTYLAKHGHENLLRDWDSAEIFNRVILNLPSFLSLTKRKEMGYASHTRSVSQYRKIWGRSSGIEQYLTLISQKGDCK